MAGGMLQHPIFSLTGINRFLADLIPVYWSGQYHWGGNPLKWEIADRFYVISSYVFKQFSLCICCAIAKLSSDWSLRVVVSGLGVSAFLGGYVTSV